MRVHNWKSRLSCWALWTVMCGLLVLVGRPMRHLDADDAPLPEVAEPFAVIAVASVDRTLEDFDALAEAVGQPNYAKFVRGFLSGLNDLRGFDRHRPVGSLMYLRADEAADLRAQFFFPTTDVEELFKTVRFGDSLRLKRDHESGDITLLTDDHELPVFLKHRFAFLNVAPDAAHEAARPPDPEALLGDALQTHDIVAILRRAGVPEELFEHVQRDIRNEAEQDLDRQAHESDVEYQLRRDITIGFYDLVSATVNEWQSISAGITFDSDSGELSLEVDVELDPNGEVQQLLSKLPTSETRFAGIVDESAPLTVAASFNLPNNTRDILQRLLISIREPAEAELDQVDEPIRVAARQLIDALDHTISAGVVDAYGQLTPQADHRFVLTGGLAIADADVVADGLLKVLPFVVEADEIRSVDLNVASAHGIAIHRLQPTKVRRHDRRLYGEEAAIYLAAGHGALWLALGDESAISALTSAIERVDNPAQSGNSLTESEVVTNSRPLLSVGINMSQWVKFAGIEEGNKSARIAALVEEAFTDSTGDAARLVVEPTPLGLKLRVEFAAGYSRLLGLVIAHRLHSPVP